MRSIARPISRFAGRSCGTNGFDDSHEVDDGDRAFIVYEARTSAGKRFHNWEMYTARNDKLVATEVYFGWNLPHRVPKGARMRTIMKARGMRDAPASWIG